MTDELVRDKLYEYECIGDYGEEVMVIAALSRDEAIAVAHASMPDDYTIATEHIGQVGVVVHRRYPHPRVIASTLRGSKRARQDALDEAEDAVEALRDSYDSGGDCSAGMGFRDCVEAATAAIRSLANPAERPEGEKT